MKKRIGAVVGLVCGLLTTETVANDRPHPRLFLDPYLVTSIREWTRIPGSHHQEAYDALKARVDLRDPTIYGSTLGYNEATLAKESAFLYLITEDESYAEMAHEMLLITMHNPEASPADARRGLARAMTGMAFALAYDWCYEGWTKQQREWTCEAIVRSLNEWTEYEYPTKGWGSGTNHVWEPYVSNWVAVCQSAQILMMLAVYEDTSTATNVYRDTTGGIVYGLSRDERYAELKAQLLLHLRLAYGPLGVTGEGNGYMAYGGSFLQPCLQAMPDAGDYSLQAEARRHGWWKCVMYSSSFAEDRLSIQNGVTSSDGISGIGYASLLLGTVPTGSLPYYVYFYDRFMGVENPRPPALKYDEDRAGTVWALLLYPEHVDGQDPTGAMPPMAADTAKGAFFFRNRWRDENDILVYFSADRDWEKGTHNIPEAFQFNLIAYGNRYAGSPGRRYRNDLQSALFVDGQPFDTTHERAGSDTGTLEFHEATEDGGYVIAGGGQKYTELGVTRARRHFRVSFSEHRNRAVIATLDQVESIRAHLYTWQMNLGDENGDRGITVETGEEDGRPYFLLRGGNNGYVKGWVLHPSRISIDAADPLRIATTGADAQMFIVMLVDSGAPEQGRVEGEGLDSRLRLGETAVWFDSTAGRIMVGSPAGTAPGRDGNPPARRAGIVNAAYRSAAGKVVLRLDPGGAAHASIEVYDALGVRLRTLPVPAGPGPRTVVWHCDNSRGAQVAPGSYLLLLRTGAACDVARVVVR